MSEKHDTKKGAYYSNERSKIEDNVSNVAKNRQVKYYFSLKPNN